MVNKVNEMQQVGSRLSVCRQNRNMTQEELAYKLGITPQALSKWERGMSLPDTSILPDIARILEISTDYLLGISQQNVLENGDCEFQRVIGENLRNTLQPLELVFGKDLVSQFSDQKYVDEIRALRLKLSHGGFLLPVFRIRDELRLESKEFMILSYQNILYSETLGSTGENTLHYIVEKLGECIQEKYFEIINPDLLKALVDNLKIKYPVLTEGVVPEKISYSRLTDMVKRTLRKGCSIAYLPKIIEIMDCLLNSQKDPSGSEAEEEIIREIKRADHFREVLERRK
ncbi:MAG: FHIPEP family type III secretion protein [Acetatifactor sp.]|nr:FHIPEP family type III secretion protein [Acetatifactor sp.]